MEIFKIEAGVVKPTIEILLIDPFKTIWERCSPLTNFARSMQEFAYIEFMCSPKKSNPYHGYAEDVKEDKIIRGIFKDEQYTPDALVKEAMDVYKEFFYEASPTLTFLEDARTGAEKLKSFFRTFDINATTDKGALLYKPADITRALSDTLGVIRTLAALEDKVHQEVFDTVKSKGDREINPFERRGESG